MSQGDTHPFIQHLNRLQDDRAAMATLRHSLSFEPGNDPKAFPLVERFVSAEWHERDARRRARYAVAGLFALHPVHSSDSLARALGELLRRKQGANGQDARHSLEMRFIALLEADADSVMNHLRQVIRLLASEGLGFDHAQLLADLCVSLDERADGTRRDALKRAWARDFYRSLQGPGASADPQVSVPSQPPASASHH